MSSITDAMKAVLFPVSWRRFRAREETKVHWLAVRNAKKLAPGSLAAKFESF